MNRQPAQMLKQMLKESCDVITSGTADAKLCGMGLHFLDLFQLDIFDRQTAEHHSSTNVTQQQHGEGVGGIYSKEVKNRGHTANLQEAH